MLKAVAIGWLEEVVVARQTLVVTFFYFWCLCFSPMGRGIIFYWLMGTECVWRFSMDICDTSQGGWEDEFPIVSCSTGGICYFPGGYVKKKTYGMSHKTENIHLIIPSLCNHFYTESNIPPYLSLWTPPTYYFMLSSTEVAFPQLTGSHMSSDLFNLVFVVVVVVVVHVYC